MQTDNRVAFRRTVASVAVGITTLTLHACQSDCPDRLIKCRSELSLLKQENTNLRQQLAQAGRTLAQQENRIERLQATSAGQVKNFIAVEKVSLDRLTGPYDDDRDGYDDGIVVYLRPVDADGHVVKAPGTVVVKLFDLNGSRPMIVGEVKFSPSQLRRSWYGRFWTNHYTVRCPFAVTVEHSPITVKVSFIEMLTGKEFTAQKACNVKAKLPSADTQPAGR